jgi:hypothetical protein
MKRFIAAILTLCVLTAASFMLPAVSAAWRINLYSVEDFYGAVGHHGMDLQYSHEDAYNFHEYANLDRETNWAGDRGVERWQFNENYDDYNWMAADASQIAYVHTHGNSYYYGSYLTMGDEWPTGDYNGIHAGTPHMTLGDQDLRYFFMVACSMLDRTYLVDNWIGALHGVRQTFGFASTAIDNPNYGIYFWDEMASGERLSNAWLDASFRINPYQSPLVLASGYDSGDARYKLDGEWGFNPDRAGHSWFAWRWYYAATSLDMEKASGLDLQAGWNQAVEGAAYAASYEVQDLKPNSAALMQTLTLNSDDYTQGLDNQGGLNIDRKNPNAPSVDGQMVEMELYQDLSGEQMLKRDAGALGQSYASAQKYAGQLGELYNLNGLKLTTVRQTYEQEMDAANQRITPGMLSETTFVFSPDLGGLGIASPDSAGTLQITIDAETGQLNGLESSLKKISVSKAADGGIELDMAQVRASARARLADELGVSPEDVKILDKYSQVGYKITGNQARLVYHCLAEINGVYQVAQDIFLD